MCIEDGDTHVFSCSLPMLPAQTRLRFMVNVDNERGHLALWGVAAAVICGELNRDGRFQHPATCWFTANSGCLAREQGPPLHQQRVWHLSGALQ